MTAPLFPLIPTGFLVSAQAIDDPIAGGEVAQNACCNRVTWRVAPGPTAEALIEEVWIVCVSPRLPGDAEAADPLTTLAVALS